jgi:hypothetical protein
MRIDSTGTQSGPFDNNEHLGWYSRDVQVIWVKEEDFKKLGALKESQKLTLVHELVHAWQDREILKKHASAEDRRAAVKQELREKVQTMSKEEFVKAEVKQEMDAERIAQIVKLEILNTYSKSTGKGGFEKEFLLEVLNTRMEEFKTDTGASYEKKAEERYEKEVASIKEEATKKEKEPPKAGTSSAAQEPKEKEETIKVRLLPVEKLEGVLFKPGESRTFDKLWSEVKGLNIQIAVYDEKVKKQLEPQK